MATRQRLRELAYADMNRECAAYGMLCGTTKTRQISDTELHDLKIRLEKEQALNRHRRNSAVKGYWRDREMR